MNEKQFETWMEENYFRNAETETAGTLAAYTGRDAASLADGLYYLSACAANGYNKDFFRDLYAAITEAAEKIKREEARRA